MLVSYNWLQEFLEKTPPPRELAEKLTMQGLEVGEVTECDHTARPFKRHVFQLRHVCTVLFFQLKQNVHFPVFGLELSSGTVAECRLNGTGCLLR